MGILIKGLIVSGLTFLAIGAAVADYQSSKTGKNFWRCYESYINDNWSMSLAMTCALTIVNYGVMIGQYAVARAAAKAALASAPHNSGIKPTQTGIEKVSNHISSNNFNSPENTAMIAKLQYALDNGQLLYGADANFYLHELMESKLMLSGMAYDVAHNTTLSYYNVSNFALYHPSVISTFPEYFAPGFFDYWGIPR